MATSSGTAEIVTRAGPKKHAVVSSLTDKLKTATSAVVTDYRGLTVDQLEELRGTLRKEGVDYVIVKNTLARRAADAAGIGQFADSLTGPVGLAIGYDEISTPARILNEYSRVNKRLPMMAGLVEGQILDAARMKTIAELPSRDVLLGQLAGTLLSPLSQLAGSLDSVLSNFAATLDAYRIKLEAA